MDFSSDLVIEYTSYERPRRLASSTRMQSMDIHGVLTFDSVPEGTQLRWSWQLDPHGVLALIRPLVAYMGRRNERRIWNGLKHFMVIHSRR